MERLRITEGWHISYPLSYLTVTEEELEIARTKVKALLKLANTITMELK